jgi:tetratricopeptide (TPR) repeat protein
MRIRVCVLAAIASFALAGCSSSPTKSGLWSWGEDTPPPANAAAAGSSADATGSTAEVTGSIGHPAEAAPDPLAVKDAMLGGDPGDDVSLGKRHYRERNYGLAEQHFRRAVEKLPRDGEAWLGLAASYDRLRRYELADRAYREALAIYGPRPEVLNNIGYSFLLRGNLRKARAKFVEAQAKDPDNPTIANNIALVDEAAKRRKGLN